MLSLTQQVYPVSHAGLAWSMGSKDLSLSPGRADSLPFDLLTLVIFLQADLMILMFYRIKDGMLLDPKSGTGAV
jgi:hypothetical protein